MLRLTRTWLIWLAVWLVVTGLTACGNGTASSDVVAHVGPTGITKAAVNHWMATLAGGDYNELSGGRRVPDGLVSEPPSYSACVTRLESAAAARPVNGVTKPTSLQLLTKCRELYRALRTQAIAFLVRTQWQIDLDRELGVTATDKEVLQFYEQNKATHPLLSSAALVRHYLVSRRLSLSDYLYILKLDLLEQKLQHMLERRGKQQATKLTEAEQRWTAKTNCSAGVVVQHCKQYRGEPEYSSSLPPSVLMEQVAALVTGRCINRPACAQ